MNSLGESGYTLTCRGRLLCLPLYLLCPYIFGIKYNIIPPKPPLNSRYKEANGNKHAKEQHVACSLAKDAVQLRALADAMHLEGSSHMEGQIANRWEPTSPIMTASNEIVAKETGSHTKEEIKEFPFAGTNEHNQCALS